MMLSQEEWLRIGIEHGYCTPPVCDTHEGAPMKDEEEEAFEDGDDPCIPIVRLL